ncbi:MAG: hypothetical protein LBU38_00055 [Propionibacteriaceae bacterium]|jgi:hypothetical protein|nr:hypothetical protein [Propionibacteriaceae bacterium]
MAYYWTTDPELSQCEKDGFDLDLGFETQEEADAWLTDFYPDLVTAGTVSVTLWENSRLVYGPMSLGDG